MVITWKREMEKKFFDLIKMMKTLFIGLVELEKHQIVHKDQSPFWDL